MRILRKRSALVAMPGMGAPFAGVMAIAVPRWAWLIGSVIHVTYAAVVCSG
jgi:hypothetical protein